VFAGFVWIAAGSLLVGTMDFSWCDEWCVEIFTIGVGSNAILQWLHLEHW